MSVYQAIFVNPFYNLSDQAGERVSQDSQFTNFLFSIGSSKNDNKNRPALYAGPYIGAGGAGGAPASPHFSHGHTT